MLGAVALGATPAAPCEQPCKQATRTCVRADCGALDGAARRECVKACRGRGGCARIRTLAWVSSTCRSDGKGTGLLAAQELFVRRRNCAPVSVRAIALPSHDCQLFSVDRLGGRLRQLTRFREGELSLNGCNTGPPPGCHVASPWEDPVTGTLVFSASCNPFGTNPYGEQLFALWPDGAALRQLTAARGYEVAADGTVSVELAGPAGYSAVY